MTKEEERAVKDELLGEKAEVGWINCGVVDSRNKHFYLVLQIKLNQFAIIKQSDFLSN